ncbi:hypothetical protein AWM75_08015 [Aerococcus urinaehominis]|uniref:SCP domain-containing protein n=1 Tax=Aerococcus urinaehominis TaxID=128944 RepID=A0A0X8FM90_9LACT|nr:cell wall-binding repeat-containing protein [Aerococcus urinaehominis]AMB99916.1 hypothetical protein AWM75_08015 [Aerococcus urinaehominis]SDM43550.1 Putative cell wall-binding protein [Aerococcus urinaehominis]
MKRPTLKYCLLTSLLAPTLLVGLSQNVQADEGNSFTVTYNPNLITIVDDPDVSSTEPENTELNTGNQTNNQTSPQTTSLAPATDNHAVDTASQNKQSDEAQDPAQIDRIAGPNRFSNAAAISQTGWETAETVLLANGYKEADALTGAPLAAIYDAPILLTREDRLPEETAAELRRLQTKKVIVLGGLKSVQQKVQDELAKSYVVERIGGKNRYHQAALVADEIHRLTGKTSPAYVTNAYAFADALSIAQVAAKQKAPIFLTKKDQVNPYIKAGQNKITSFTIVGGPASINSQVENQLKALKPTERISGKNRYRVSQNIINKYGSFKENDRHLYVVSGEAFADALAASVLANKVKTPMLLVRNQAYELGFTGQFMLSMGVRSLTLIGGPRTITPATSQKLASYLKFINKSSTQYPTTTPSDTKVKLDFTRATPYLKPGKIIPDSIDIKQISPNLTLKEALEMQGGIWTNPKITNKGNKLSIVEERKNITNGVRIILPKHDLSIKDLRDGNYKAPLDDYLITMTPISFKNTPITVNNFKEYVPYAFIEAFNNNMIFSQEKLNHAFAKLLNAERARKGLNPLQVNTDPRVIAANHSRTLDLARHGYLKGYNLDTGEFHGAHTTPNGLNVKQYYQTKDLGPWRYSGENSASNFITSVFDLTNEEKIAQTFFNQWKNSPGHYANMMTNFGNDSGTFHLSVKAGDFYYEGGQNSFYKSFTANFVTFHQLPEWWQG